MLLEVEADQGLSDAPDSLMDRVLVGIITLYSKYCLAILCTTRRLTLSYLLPDENPSAVPEQSDYLATLLRDPTSSHLLETLVTRAPNRAFAILWSTYFQGKLSRLSAHPVANFVIARALEKINAEQLGEACEELKDSWAKIISV